VLNSLGYYERTTEHDHCVCVCLWVCVCVCGRARGQEWWKETHICHAIFGLLNYSLKSLIKKPPEQMDTGKAEINTETKTEMLIAIR